MQGWAAQELRTVNLGDARRERRLIHLVEALAARPASSVPEACVSKAATKAAYRFWNSPEVSETALLAAHRDSTIERVREHSRVLVVQDTTELNFTAHPRTQGLGGLSGRQQRGLFKHSAMAVSVEGTPLGLVHWQMWARQGKAGSRRQRPTSEKESRRWLEASAASRAAIPEDIEMVTIADREADIYELFVAARRPNEQWLIRAVQNRRVAQGKQYLWDAVRQLPCAGTMTLTLGRSGERQPRQAQVSVRWGMVTLHPPRHHGHRRMLPTLPVNAVLVEEEHPPVGEPAVCWLLLTTLPVNDFESAMQCVRWYSYRWLIERYHFVLKSGCRVESLQLETAERLRRAVATYAIVAWRLLWLTYKARQDSQASCELALEAHEWQALYCTVHKTTHPPATPPTLHQAVHWIAQLGGFLGRKSDGDPGVKTLWRGWRRLSDIAATWLLLRSPDVGNA